MSTISEVKIHGIGMCTSLSDYNNASAAYRVGLNRFISSDEYAYDTNGDDVELENEKELEPLQISPLPEYLSLSQGVEKLIDMLRYSFDDLNQQLDENTMNDISLNAYFSLPEISSGHYTSSSEKGLSDEALETKFRSDLTTNFIHKIAPELSIQNTDISFGDRVSFFQNMAAALSDLNDGKVEYCLVFAVDSLLNTELVSNLLKEKKLKTDENPNGFIPSEGAVAILLSKSGDLPNKIDHLLKIAIDFEQEPMQEKAQGQLQGQSQDDSKIIENENIKIASWQGRCLSDITLTCFQQFGLSSGNVNWFSDMNGDVMRATETGMFQVKIKHALPNINFPLIQTPVASFGELGLISGGVFFALIIFQMERECLDLPNTLITLSEDSGKRSVMLLI